LTRNRADVVVVAIKASKEPEGATHFGDSNGCGGAWESARNSWLPFIDIRVVCVARIGHSSTNVFAVLGDTTVRGKHFASNCNNCCHFTATHDCCSHVIHAAWHGTHESPRIGLGIVLLDACFIRIITIVHTADGE
jgi:hypothetical protein